MEKNLILIGMPSSGKSTAGILLAKSLGYGFIDSDLLIQNSEKALLSEIIEREGTEGFIRIEEKINAELWATRCVIATGGSAVYGEKAMEHFRNIGKIIYLRLDPEFVKKRIPNLAKRGVVMRGNLTTVEELYEERRPLYEKYADATVDWEGRSMDDFVTELISVAKGLLQ